MNRRSRPALVEFPTLVLNEAFRVLGIDPGAVPVTPFREDAEGQSAPLALWRVPGRNAGLAQAALAARIARMVREGETMPVAARDEVWRTRPLRAGDIAVLVRKNDHARDLAAALAASGLKVALERDGLLDRAECVLALAGLRVLADSSDTLALAEIAHLREGDTARPVWLDTVLAHSAGARSLRELPFAQALAAAPPDLCRLTPAEVLDLAIATLDLPALLPRWGDPAARHANLGALRALAAEYEADCRRERLPGSAAGLAAWFDTRDGQTQPASPDPDAVQVLTCHRAKGLEWPCVILADLDADDTPRLFNSPVAVAPPDGLDMDDPLRGRGVRLWPWPYGAQGTNVGLDTTALATAEGQEAAQSLKEENLRLLYVALTRARDYLVLAPRVSVTRAGARLAVDWLKMVPGAPLDLPATGDRVMIDGTPLPMIVEDLAAAATKASMLPDAWTAILPPGPPPDFAPRRLSPSAASGGDAPAYDVVILGDRLPLTGNADMRTLGEALHGFFAADRPGADRAWRLALAERLFRAWAVTEMAPEHALTAADRLWSYLDRTWPGAERHREWPVFARRDGQTLSGRADLVIAHGAGLAVFDHKSFPGPSRDWPALAAEYAPQLAAYASALEAATERKVDRRVVHLPVAGVLLVLR